MVLIKSMCDCIKYWCEDYNEAANGKEYMERIKQNIALRRSIIKHEETCSVFNGEFNQFLVRR